MNPAEVIDRFDLTKPQLERLIRHAWDESKHPRHEKGSEKGGEFAPQTKEVSVSNIDAELQHLLGGPNDPSKAADMYAEFWHGTDEQRAFREDYGGNDDSLAVNRALREGASSALAEGVVDRWDSAFTPSHKDVTVFRTIKGEEAQLDRLLGKGTVLGNAGYTSTAFAVENAAWFVSNMPGSQPNAEAAVFRIKVPKGTKVAPGSAGERELVLARDTKLKLIKVERKAIRVKDSKKSVSVSSFVSLVDAEVVP